MENEYLKKIIELQEKQIDRYDTYMKMFLSKGSNTSMFKEERISVNLEDLVKQNLDMISDEIIIDALESQRPATQTLITLIEQMLEDENKRIPVIYLPNGILKFLDNGMYITESASIFTIRICGYLFEKCKPFVEMRSLDVDPETADPEIVENKYTMDTNRHINLMLLRETDSQNIICKKILSIIKNQ